MKIISFSYCALMLITLSCSKGNDTALNTGTYTGTALRSCGINESCAAYPAPTLKLVLVNGKFKAQSLLEQFGDASCEGTYTQNGDSIYFSNNCTLPSDADPTIKIEGAYQVRYKSQDSLSFRRSLDLSNPDYPVVTFSLKLLGAGG